MGVLEKNRPEPTAKAASASNVAVQKATSQNKAPEKTKTQDKSTARKKSDDGAKKTKTGAASGSSKTSAAKVCVV
jgi:hypothetical protein